MKRKSKSPLSKLGEFGLIDRIQNRQAFASKSVVRGIGDDCAVYRTSPGRFQVITTDALVENVHFIRKSHPPELLGRKTLAVSLSDLAAMGAKPILAVLALGVPRTLDLKFLDRFFAGFHGMCREFSVELAGGDTVRSPKEFWVSLTLVGDVPAKRFFTRSGAKAGHVLMVTGTLGDSALGLKLLSGKTGTPPISQKEKSFLMQRHFDPEPRIDFSRKIAASSIRVSSMIDVSDGLVQDLGHLCHMSGKGADLDGAAVPRSKQFEKVIKNKNLDEFPLCFEGGEDYELLFTTPPEDVKKIITVAKKVGLPVSEIGKITRHPGRIRLLQENESPKHLKPTSGYNHFS
ncbi:MAG: thiamine-phosphate kinase [Nitrospina sp.]|nr:thiamine-phosphate kinase [Nitrospina sp.]